MNSFLYVLDVAYLFQNIAELQKEQLDSTVEYSSDVDTCTGLCF